MAQFGVNPHGRWDKVLAQDAFQSHVHNIMNKYKEASPEMVKGGHEWYERAHDVAAKVGKGDVEKGAGIIAALSPQTGWSRNVELSHRLVQTGHAEHTADNLQKAQRIQAGEHPMDVLGGHKVRSFYQNIADPSNPHPVTIDRHAHDIAVGIPFRGTSKATEKAGSLGLSAIGRYQHFERSYKAASEQLGIEHPHKVQATTWVQHRGAIG